MEKPSSERRQRKRQQTASHISAIAYALFEAQGFDTVSMEQIADRADVAKATLYSYFPVKEALLAHRFREDIAIGMAERANALSAHRNFADRMRFLLRESAEWHNQRRVYMPHYLRFLTSQSQCAQAKGNERATDTAKILTDLFHAGQQAGELSSSLGADDMARSLEYLLFGEMAAWLKDPAKSLSERFLTVFDVLMHGVARPLIPNVKESIL